ncbi:TraB/GumN family protein [Lysobacter koreensis]|uniref:TraB/GumN family protein n=1 Tax=Lysobacter koreensis TaxID=266122 RepID=A0ABW2YJB0_9GAMM
MRNATLLGLSVLAVALLAAAPLIAPAQDAGSVAPNPATSTATPTTAMPAASAAKAPPLPLLWKLSDADNAVYLLGSFHLLKPDDYPVSKDIDNAFAAADKLVFEVPPAEISDPAVGQKALLAAGYGDARTLSTVLPPDLRDKFSAMLAQRGGSIAQLDAYEPWFVNLSLVMGVSQAMGFRAENGLDQHLMRQAATAGKPTSGLETIDVQLRTLDSTPMAEQIVSLQEFVDEPQKMPGLLSELHQAWRDGDLAKLDEMTRGEMLAKTPETYRLLNVVRNDAWMPQIRALLDGSKTDDTLVVVGAMHLLGPDGLVDRMRAGGYKVERVCSACTGLKAEKAVAPAANQ